MDENKIFDIKKAKFYLPNYPVDCISQYIVGMKDYWDRAALFLIDKYLADGSTILDIGANVGSHTIYWALERNAKKIYSFEPLEQTFKVLCKNIELNNLEKIVTLSNKGLSNEKCKAKVRMFWEHNVGGTSFIKNEDGEYDFVPLDSIEIPEKIDLVKIDVEGHEMEVLEGAKNTLYRNKPVIVIETFNKKTEVSNFLTALGYSLVDTIREGEDYIFKYNEVDSFCR